MSGPEPAAVVAGDARKVMYDLGDAVTRAVEALRAIPAGDEVAAYSCVRALDTALTGLADLLALVPGSPSWVIRRQRSGTAWTDPSPIWSPGTPTWPATGISGCLGRDRGTPRGDNRGG